MSLAFHPFPVFTAPASGSQGISLTAATRSALAATMKPIRRQGEPGLERCQRGFEFGSRNGVAGCDAHLRRVT